MDLADYLRSLNAAIQGLSGTVSSLQSRISTIEKTKEQKEESSEHYGLGQPLLLTAKERGSMDWIELVFRKTVDANAEAVVTKEIGTSGHFWLRKITSVHTGAYRLKLQDNKSGRNIIQDNDWVHVNNTAGTAQLPYMIEGFRVYEAGTSITVTFNDLSGERNEIELVLHGIKILLA